MANRYKVKPGDSWLSLADQYQLSPQTIMDANLGVNDLYPGMEINFPYEKIIGAVTNPFQKLGDAFGALFPEPINTAFQPGLGGLPSGMVERMMPPKQEQAALPGPRVDQLPRQAVPPFSASSAAHVTGGGLRAMLQDMIMGSGNVPQHIMGADLRLAYPGWTKEKELAAMQKIGFIYDAASDSYSYAHPAPKKAGATGGVQGERGEVTPWGEAGEIVATGSGGGYVRRYPGGRVADYGKRGQRWKFNEATGLTMPDYGRGAGKRAWRAQKGTRVQVSRQTTVGYGGNVGLVWRVGS